MKSDPGDSFPVRLIQLQVAIVYLSTGLTKLYGVKWQNGTALAYTLQLDSFSRHDWQTLVKIPLLINLMTYGTLLFEVSFFFLVLLVKPTGLFGARA